MYTLLLAWRYAHSRWVNLVAVLAVALALTVQIVVMAVLDGTLEDMKRRVRDLGEQVTLSFAYPLPTEKDLADVTATLQGISSVKGITPLVYGFGIIESRHDMSPAMVYGVDIAREARWSELSQHIEQFKLDSKAPSWFAPGTPDPGRPGMLIGARLAENLGNLTTGDTVNLSYALPGEEKLRRKTFHVSGTFRSGSPYKDDYGVYIPIQEARLFFLAGTPEETADKIQTFSIWLENPDRADDLEDPIRRAAIAKLNRSPRSVTSSTWSKKWRSMAEGMKHENNLQEIILLLMNLSGGFCVFAILSTLVSRRVRDVGLLRCLGAGRFGVVVVFLLVGLFIGLIGSALGVAGGYFCAPRIDGWFKAITGEPLYPPRMYGILKLETLVDAWTVLFYAAGATLISMLAAVYPAVWAGTREPVEALRDE